MQPERNSRRLGMNQMENCLHEDLVTPFVSVVMPVRNESEFIEECLQSICRNSYPRESLEILVLDGMSDDDTRRIVKRLARSDSRICLVENPRKTVSDAMNMGIKVARGQIIIRIDGHALVPKNFIAESVKSLCNHPEAWCAGGIIEIVNESHVGQAIAGALTSPVGVGNARFRLGSFEGYADTVAWGAYWRWVFDKIGFFDAELIRNQDDELNHRLVQAGGKIWISSSVRSKYFPRMTFRKLGRQYFQYGFWRIRAIQKRGRPATLRQVIPLVFVSIWILLIAGGFFWPSIWRILLGYAGIYGILLAAGVFDVHRRFGFRAAGLAPLVFMTLHFCYGFGSLWGLVWFVFLGRKSIEHPEEYAMSR